MAITTGGEVTLTAGSLPSNFCHTSWQSTLNNFVSSTNVTFANGALFAAGASAPSSTDRLWCKLDSGGNVLGWYWHDGSDWAAVPVPVISALPDPGATAGTYGDADNHVTVTVGADGYVTGVAEVAPTATTDKGLAKAWMKFASTGSGVSASNSYRCTAERLGAGSYRIETDDTYVSFSNSPIVICSYDGVDHSNSSSTTTSVTVRPAISVTTSLNGSTGRAAIDIYRAQFDSEDATDGDLNWDEEGHDGNAINVVFFGD